MNDTTGAVTTAKAKTEVTKVKMLDGREVDFAGKRNINKGFTLGEDSVTATFDFRTGDTLSLEIMRDDPMILQLAGHGLVQKGGDEAAGVKDEVGNPDVPSMVLGVEAILNRIADTGKSLDDRWYAETAAGDGFSGASVVIKAIMEASGKDQTFIKGFLEKKLEAGKGEGLTRQKMYAAYRKPGTKTGIILARMEQEKLAAASSSVDADAELAEMVAG